MGTSLGMLLLHSAILTLSTLTFTTSEPYYIESECANTGNFTINSTYKANLNTLLHSMSSNASLHNGFYNCTAGQDSDKIYGIFLCRVGINSDTCRDCISTSTKQIIQDCPNQKEAIIWYLDCMLRYSNVSIFATMKDSPPFFFYFWELATLYPVGSNPTDVPDALKSIFNQVLGNLMSNLVRRVVSGPGLMFAAGDANYTSIQKIWGLVQCTPDISLRDCKTCLQRSISDIPICCDGQLGGGVYRTSCSLRFAPGAFYDFAAFAPPPAITFLPPPPNNITITRGNGAISSSKIVIICTVPTVIILIIVSIICFFLRRRSPKKNIDVSCCEDVDMIRSVEFLQMDFNKIRASTNDFSDANKLGEGGFGVVYKGMMLNGEEVAVKRLSKNSRQGDIEFKNEVVLLAKLYHKNLVRLLGFCLGGGEKLLIYEFMPNASLDHFIFGLDPVKHAQLDWERRYKIIGGIIRGLLYLHEGSQLKIIHRDLKVSNILLDEDMNPKISDFGTARLFAADQTQENTKKTAGTFGYMAPEYVRNGRFSVKSDVFSFGVLLLEIVSGRRNTNSIQSEHPENLLSDAWRKWKEGMALELMDPNLRECYSRSEVMRCIHIGLLCVQESVAERPTMASVALMFNSDSFTLPIPSHPAFFLHSKTESDMPLREYNCQSNEVSISELCPR